MRNKDMKTKIENLMFHIKTATVAGKNKFELYADVDRGVIEELRNLNYEVSYIEDHLVITW